MTTRDIEAQFVIEAPQGYGPLFTRYQTPMSQAFGTALLMAFGYPLDTAVNLRVHFADRFQLLEANGEAGRTPSSEEVQGLLLGCAVATAIHLSGSLHTVVDLKGGRVTDA